MNEYLNSLEKINHCIEQIQSLDATSIELNTTSIHLEKNLQPCFTEINKFLSSFEELIKPCFDTIEKAENVWESKARICKVSSLEIMEELGKLTGKEIRIKRLNEKNKQEITEFVLNYWRKKSLELKNKYFQWDEVKNKYKNDHLKVFVKDDFIKSLLYDLNQFEAVIIENLREKLQLIYQEIIIFINPIFNNCIDSLDKITKEKIDSEVLELSKNIKNNFGNPTLYLPESYTNSFLETLLKPFNKFSKQSNLTNLFRISLESYDNSTLETEKIAEQLVIDICNQKTDLILKRIDEIIYFYNDFLQKQHRYKEELLLQHNIEKIWIDAQKKELKKLMDNINLTLAIFN